MAKRNKILATLDPEGMLSITRQVSSGYVRLSAYNGTSQDAYGVETIIDLKADGTALVVVKRFEPEHQEWRKMAEFRLPPPVHEGDDRGR